MLDRAIGKLTAEMEANKNNIYIQIIGGFLQQQINKTPAEAEKILHEGKTIKASLNEVKNYSRPKAVDGCAPVSDEEVFAVVLKYFGINDRPEPYIPPTLRTGIAPVSEKNAQSIKFDVDLDDLV